MILKKQMFPLRVVGHSSYCDHLTETIWSNSDQPFFRLKHISFHYNLSLYLVRFVRYWRRPKIIDSIYNRIACFSHMLMKKEFQKESCGSSRQWKLKVANSLHSDSISLCETVGNTADCCQRSAAPWGEVTSTQMTAREDGSKMARALNPIATQDESLFSLDKCFPKTNLSSDVISFTW